jgi:hypothetical protein
MSSKNARTCRFAGLIKRCSPGSNTKNPVPTILHCSNRPAPMVAPQSLSRVLPSATSRFQWSTWCSPSRSPASSLPTPASFQAATLRSRSTQPIHTSNEMYLALIQLSTPDIVRQTTHNSNRASMTCKPRTSHRTALSHRNEPHNSALPLHGLVIPSATTNLDRTTLHFLFAPWFRPRPSPPLKEQLCTSSAYLSAALGHHHS